MWEGGVHGVGFVHSKLLQKPGIRMNNMIHVSDWLPTLYSAAGGQTSDFGKMDGLDLWNMIQTNGSNVRTELLHNIDPISKFSSVRVGDYKLVQGDISGQRNDDWYPCNPPKETETENRTDDRQKRYDHFSRHGDFVVEFEAYQPKTNDPFIIKCGERPPDYKTNCQPTKSPCLFNIVKDPCEYNNIADLFPDVVKQLQQRIEDLAKTAVPPANKPGDKNADPALHGGVWVPWLGSETP